MRWRAAPKDARIAISFSRMAAQDTLDGRGRRFVRADVKEAFSHQCFPSTNRGVLIKLPGFCCLGGPPVFGLFSMLKG